MKAISIYFLNVFLVLCLLISCKKENNTPEETHPFAGTVRLQEEKRGYFLEYNVITNSFFFRRDGLDQLIELIPGTKNNQYYIRPKDYPTFCLDYSTRNDGGLKLYTFAQNDAQLFTITDIGNKKVKIQCVVDTSLYLLNNSDLVSSSYSSFLKQKSTYPTALDYWIIDEL